ncbi:MAG: cobalt-precorrin 5A hydrolase [Geobacteraceae bacterium]|nr:cobalt-precorrin 5A hydrolase [Geobacteraceae bacterium]NTW78788.1 cobalt-precorrin 5A hydrolase [Geobacteraceae bacterium]
MRVAIVAITRRGAQLGQRLSENMAGLEFYVSRRYAAFAGNRYNSFEPNELKTLISSFWNQYDGLVLIMATGIVVRMISPLLQSKETDPAVVVMDDAGRFAIALLSGHLGGANELAGRCAFTSGACAVITTATDANDLPSFDMLAKEQGWTIDDISKVKALNTLMLDNEEIAAFDPTGKTGPWLNDRGNVTFYGTIAEAANSGARGFLFVTNNILAEKTSLINALILRPRNLVLGLGCNRDTPADEIEAFVMAHLNNLSLSPKSIFCIASVAAKRDEAGLVEFAGRLAVPLRCFEADELNQVAFPSPPSEHALAAVGAAGVAEPAAILASSGGLLLLEKVKSSNVTLAVAELKGG